MSEQRQGRRGEEDGSPSRQGTSPVEWVAAALSALLVAGTIAFLLHDALRSPPAPPVVRIEVESTARAGRGWVVEFRAVNRGPTTAAGLTVEGTLHGDAGAVETSQVTIDYVPADGSRGGGLFFTKNPREYRLQIRPMGYDRP